MDIQFFIPGVDAISFYILLNLICLLKEFGLTKGIVSKIKSAKHNWDFQGYIWARITNYTVSMDRT